MCGRGLYSLLCDNSLLACPHGALCGANLLWLLSMLVCS